MTLYLKHRPTGLDEMFGNTETLELLEGTLEHSPPQAYLLSGPTGCGKTTLARIIVDYTGCNTDHDLVELNSADFRGIDTVRQISQLTQFQPSAGPVKVWIIDECHQLTRDAQNAMLKLLEDTPPDTIFILATTDPQKLLKAIQNRCAHFQVGPLTLSEMTQLVKQVAEDEDETVGRELCKLIHTRSEGRPRDALQILSQVLVVEESKRLQVVEKFQSEEHESIELCRALLDNSAWKQVRDILTGLKGQDPEGIRRHVLGYASAVLLRGENDRAGLVIEEFIEPFYNTGFPGLVYAAYSVIRG